MHEGRISNLVPRSLFPSFSALCVCVCVCVQNKRWAVEPGNEAKDSLLPSVLAIQCHEYHPCRTGCHTAVHVLGCV